MKPRFVLGKKEDIQLSNLDSFIKLMQLYRQEQLPYQAPTFEFWMKVWETPNLEEEEEFWVIALDESDKAIGYGLASWSVKYDNLDKAILRIFVNKEERRKGIGTQIISLLIENTPEQIDVISLGTVTTTDDGLQYLKRLKLEKCYEEVLQYVDLEKTDAVKIRKIANEQREKATNLGYDIKFIEGLDFASHLDYPKYIQLVERIWNDMPLEDLHQEKLVMGQERYESYIKHMIGFGGRILTFVLVHKETNEPIGYTNIFLNDHQSQVVQQEDTGVLHEHRGKGLGYALKMLMFEKILDESNAKYWSTGNAVSNQHMIKINTDLNHEKFANFQVYEFKKEEWSELIK